MSANRRNSAPQGAEDGYRIMQTSLGRPAKWAFALGLATLAVAICDLNRAPLAQALAASGGRRPL